MSRTKQYIENTFSFFGVCILKLIQADSGSITLLHDGALVTVNAAAATTLMHYCVVNNPKD